MASRGLRLAIVRAIRGNWKTMKTTLAFFCPIAIAFTLAAQPNQPVPKADLLKLTGDFEKAYLGRDVRILWLYGPEDHRGGEHDYVRVKEVFVPLLQKIPRVSVDEAYQFPSQDQFDKADLLIQFLHQTPITDEQFASYQKFVDDGGGVVSIHESCIIRPIDRARKLADCIGCSWKGNKESRWSKFSRKEPLFLDTRHPAFAGLPKSMRFNDESYWNMIQRDEVKVIGAVGTSANKEDQSFAEILRSEGARGQAFWTYASGKGRVFGTTTGHFTYTYHDPMYRLLLVRGIAWALGQKPGAFVPIVFDGITDDKGMVGTRDAMMNYKNRRK
ncbi:MAG: ThuA domain-containing protein [Verrucomicrobiota bacterium]|nr:ThuA domain-containing protein [Verrucomicrobiota bacterium]